MRPADLADIDREIAHDPLDDVGEGGIDEPGFAKEIGHALYSVEWGRNFIYRHPLQSNGAGFKAELNLLALKPDEERVRLLDEVRALPDLEHPWEAFRSLLEVLCSAQAGDRAQEQLLVRRRRAAAQRPADHPGRVVHGRAHARLAGRQHDGTGHERRKSLPAKVPGFLESRGVLRFLLFDASNIRPLRPFPEIPGKIGELRLWPEILATNAREERIDASAALAGKDLLLRGQESLYCISQ